MFGRPRCREYTPLATQQLRLRSLIQIVGYNIRPPEGCMYQCSFYVTLHHTTMSAPFYTSERICSPHPKWKEIDSEITHRMSSTNVVIRIWCHILQPNKDCDESDRRQDTVIQTWGVYFTGLRYLGANLALNFTSDCFKSNTLVFQMHGGYFCSYKSLKLDIIPPENEMEHSSLSSDSSSKTNMSKSTLESKLIQRHKVTVSRSISPSKYSRKSDKEYSKSHSPVERGFQQNFPTIKNSASLNIDQTNREIKSEERNVNPNLIYEHSPDNLDVNFRSSDVNCDNLSKNSKEDLSSKIDLSETAENYDLRNESEVPKYRYNAISFLKSEIRPSYNSDRLQKLHILQYSIKKRQEAVQEIKEKIYKNSALACSLSQLDEFGDGVKLRSRSKRNLFSPDEDLVEDCQRMKNGKLKDDKPVSNGPRLALKLNDLLSFKAKPSPFQRAEHVRLTKQIEILRFKRILLADERDSKLANIRRLKEMHAKLCEENQDLGLELMQGYHSLSRRTDRLKEQRLSAAALRELAAGTHRELATHSDLLLQQLAQIFYIEQLDQTTWKIVEAPLPVCSDGARAAAAADAVAAGYAAQAVVLAAAILNLPLRYKITLLGSATKILDITPDLPDPNIPLFARSGDSTLFRYAMFLLNKCIAQLLWARGLPVTDMRPTLANLQKLMITPHNASDTAKLFGTYRWPENRCHHTQSLRSLVASDRGTYRQFNRFKDAVDGRSPQAVMTLSRHRHSRSVGSYNDDQESPALDQSTTSIMGSEPNIYNTKLSHANSVPQAMKSHNSDSEILRLTENRDKVLFTLGDDCINDIHPERLVKLSSNNDDVKMDDVKKICTEIKDFCHKEEEGFDVVKHLEADIDIAKYMEGKTSVVTDVCDDCDVCDVSCAKVTDVIVIPSAEAILDTGQETDVQE